MNGGFPPISSLVSLASMSASETSARSAEGLAWARSRHQTDCRRTSANHPGCEKPLEALARATKESSLRPWRSFHAREAFCTNQSCARATRRMVFTQPTPIADTVLRAIRRNFLSSRLSHASVCQDSAPADARREDLAAVEQMAVVPSAPARASSVAIRLAANGRDRRLQAMAVAWNLHQV